MQWGQRETEQLMQAKLGSGTRIRQHSHIPAAFPSARTPLMALAAI